MKWSFLVSVLLIFRYVECNEYRLPTTLSPIHYDIKIITHLDEPQDAFRFTGLVRILINCKVDTKNIVLHSKELTILEDKTQVTEVKTQKNIQIKNQTTLKNDFYVINLGKTLKEDTKYMLNMQFEGVLVDGLAGYYRSSYIDSRTKEKKWLAITQFQATDARRAFPCFDEPEFKAIFKITLGHHSNYSSLSNMPLNQTVNIINTPNWIWDEFDETVPMSTYLVAFAVSDFQYKMSPRLKNGNDVRFKIWARPDAKNQVNFAKDIGPKALRYYEEFFNIKYPLPKMDMIAIPDFSSGAMENWGLVTYRETLLLYDPLVSSLKSKHSITSVIAHELAHQWFGNLVTMNWWTDLWLNEGFATFMAAKAVEHLFPNWNSLSEDVVENLLMVYSLDALKSSHQISIPIKDSNEISEIFDVISYKKGSFLIRMMSLFLGENVLRKGVSNYLAKHAYKNAEQDDLWHHLTLQAHEDKVLPRNLTVKQIMDTWTLQTGYPVVTIKMDCEKKEAQISQERYLLDEIGRERYTKSWWWVPISYTTADELDFHSTEPKLWLSSDPVNETIESDCDSWLIANIQASGLYKVNYDKNNWELIINTLLSNNFKNIPTINRVILIDNALDLAKSGYINYETAFELLKYLKKEDEYLPWKTALVKLKHLARMLRRSPIYGTFKKYLSHLITPVYKKLGDITENSMENQEEKLDTVSFKSLIADAACHYKVSTCNQDAIQLFKEWQDNVNEPNRIPQDLRLVVYCAAIENGGEKEWNFLWNQYKNSNVGTEKQMILAALGCTKELWLLNKYLEWSIDSRSGIRKQDAMTVFSVVARNEFGFFVAKIFLEDKLKAVHKSVMPNSQNMKSYIYNVAFDMVTEYEHKELMNLVSKNKQYFRKAKLGIQQAFEAVSINVEWQKKYRSVVENILLQSSDI